MHGLIVVSGRGTFIVGACAWGVNVIIFLPMLKGVGVDENLSIFIVMIVIFIYSIIMSYIVNCLYYFLIFK